MDINTDIITRIKQMYPTMSKSHKRIAGYITDHYDQAVFMTAAKLGSELDISESTVVRFAAGIGYEGYPQFQKALEDWVKGQLNSVQRIGVKYAGRSQSEVLTSVLNADIEKIQDTIVNLDTEAFTMAVDIILNAKNVYILGIRTSGKLSAFLSEHDKRKRVPS